MKIGRIIRIIEPDEEPIEEPYYEPEEEPIPAPDIFIKRPVRKEQEVENE